MKKIKVVHIYDAVYKAAIVFYITKNKKDVIRRVKKEYNIKLPKGSGTGEATTWFVAKVGCIIWLPEFKLTPKCISVLLHEIMHVVLYVFARSGIVVSHNNDEASAYYIEWLVGKFLKEVKK